MTTQVFLDVLGRQNAMVLENEALLLWLNVKEVTPIWSLDSLIQEAIPGANSDDTDGFLPQLKAVWLVDLTLLQKGHVAVLILQETDTRIPHVVVITQDDGQHEVAREQYQVTAHRSIFIAEFDDIKLEGGVQYTIASELY
jgi:hypothetical protein